MKLYGVSETSPVGMLVSEIETLAKAKNLTLSRWQANKGRWQTTISYAVHSGERAKRYSLQTDMVAGTRFSGIEGSTERCATYRALSKVLASLKQA